MPKKLHTHENQYSRSHTHHSLQFCHLASNWHPKSIFTLRQSQNPDTYNDDKDVDSCDRRSWALIDWAVISHCWLYQHNKCQESDYKAALKDGYLSLNQTV